LVLARVYAPVLWWQLLGFYSLTVPTGAYGLAKAFARLGGRELSTPDIGALMLSVVFMLQGWLVIDGAQRLFARRGESVRGIPLALIPAYPLAMAIGAFQILVSAGRNWISVDGARYRLDARNRTAVARAPFSATSGP
jgi:hypothetical protein